MQTISPETKAQIDTMSYKEMLRIWRFAPAGSSHLLQGDTGEYFKNEMFRKKDELPHDQQVAISKELGWKTN